MSSEQLNNEQTGMENLSSSIITLLLEEGKVVIPELGYLELKVFPDKRTVLFKATENDSLFLASEGSIQSIIYNKLSLPLKEGQMVNMPEIGIFRSMKNTDGSYRISYTISSSLRRLLNNGEKEDKEENRKISTLPVKTDDENMLIPVVETIDAQKSENSESGDDIKKKAESKTENEDIGKRNEKTAPTLPKHDTRNSRKQTPGVLNNSKVGDVVVPPVKTKKGSTKTGCITVLFIVVIAFIIGIVILCLPNRERDNNRDDELNSVKSTRSIDLPALAEQKYGNRIFWVYIYDANRDKISSPVNIPAGTVLRLPNLWEDYKVDTKDSLEIKRAGVLSDIMLKQEVKF